MRETIDKGLHYGQRSSAKSDFAELAELGKKLNLSGPTDLSLRIDDILYGDEKA